MKKVYLAAKFSRREEMEQLAKDLPDVGLVCIARWVYGGEDGLSRRDIAELDLDDVSRADMLILFTHERSIPQPGGGRFVEFGYALALGKRCVVVGPEENIFCAHERVEVYPSWKDFLEHEKSISDRKLA